jgi:hypothetical protein
MLAQSVGSAIVELIAVLCIEGDLLLSLTGCFGNRRTAMNMRGIIIGTKRQDVTGGC